MGLRLLIAAAASLTLGCASTGAVPRPFPLPSDGTATATAESPMPGGLGGERESPGGLSGYAISSTALDLRGAPYRDGGADPRGFDCSGLVAYVFAQHGLALPRDVRGQFSVGRSVAVSDLAPGDLVFFTTVAPGVSHVGIAIGGDQFVHAPGSGGVVRVDRLGAEYWGRRFIAARRMD
jgi:cell wall-associated NlpC family hydrolase